MNTYIIDDSAHTLYLHRHFLNAYTFFENLLEYQDANKALDHLLQDNSNNQNLVLLDLNMPIMSGWEFVDKVFASLKSEQLDNIIIIVVSTFFNPKDISRAEAHPFIHSVMEKPFLTQDIDELINKLNSVVNQEKLALYT